MDLVASLYSTVYLGWDGVWDIAPPPSYSRSLLDWRVGMCNFMHCCECGKEWICLHGISNIYLHSFTYRITLIFHNISINYHIESYYSPLMLSIKKKVFALLNSNPELSGLCVCVLNILQKFTYLMKNV